MAILRGLLAAIRNHLLYYRAKWRMKRGKRVWLVWTGTHWELNDGSYEMPIDYFDDEVANRYEW